MTHYKFVVPSIRESTTDYDEIQEYEDLKQTKEEKSYENNEVVEKVCVSLKPMVMETIRDHMRSIVSVLCKNHVILIRSEEMLK